MLKRVQHDGKEVRSLLLAERFADLDTRKSEAAREHDDGDDQGNDFEGGHGCLVLNAAFY